MSRNRSLARTALVASLLTCASARAGAPASLDEMLTPHLARHGLPALAAAVVKGGEVIAVGAVGTRRAGAQIAVTRDDRFHLGSDTKAFTSLLAAIFVEEGKLRWDSTLAEVFPKLEAKIDPGLRKATLAQFLSHTSGIPGDNEAFKDLLGESMLQDGNLDELRAWLVGRWSVLPLASKPGEKFAYANINYIIAGTMLERVGGATWEELVMGRIFAPLDLRTAGFGPQASLGKIDAPVGHGEVDGKPKAFLAGPNGDNPPILGPAGTAHMSVLDFARWAGWHAGGGRRRPELVRPETLKTLHTPVIPMSLKEGAPGTPSAGKYALGWGEKSVPWAPEPLLFHGGSNTHNIAYIWIDTKADFAMVLLTNIGGTKADEALRALSSELYAKFAGPGPGPL